MAPRQPPLFDDVLLGHRRRAAERLRREVMGGDGSLRHPYFRALDRCLSDYRSIVDLDKLVRACAQADVVYVADFHALPACQLFAADLVEALAPRVSSLAIGVEFVYTRQQAWLDRRQAGLLDDAGLRRRIRYDDEWGYPWAGYGALLDRARRLDIQVHALDIAPRGGFDGLRRRDAHAARRIQEILERAPGTTLVVLFGESHVARPHLPRHVDRRLARAGRDRRTAIVAQNPDRLHWRVLQREGRQVPAVRIDDETFAVFNTGPFEKYESYRQLLERWRDGTVGEGDADLTSAIHHLIGMFVRWLGIRPARRRVRHRAGWTERLEDAFPEVFSGAEAAALLEPVLAEHGRVPAEIAEARSRLRRGGTVFDRRSNSMFVTRYAPASAAGECALFLRAALAGRLYVGDDDWRGDPVALLYGAAYQRAIAVVGSRFVDPEGYAGAAAARAPTAAAAGGPPRPGGPPSVRGALEAHRRLEAADGRRLDPALVATLGRDRALRRALADELGRRAGAALVQRMRDGRADAAALRQAFSRRLTPRNAAAVVLELLRDG